MIGAPLVPDVGDRGPGCEMWNREDLQRLSAGPRSLWRARQLKMITVRRFCHAHALPIALVVLAAVGTVIHAILPKIRGRIREVNPSAAGGRPPAGRDNTGTFVLSLSFALTLSYFLFFSYSLPPLLFLDDTLNLVESLLFLTSLSLSRSLSLSLSHTHTHTHTNTPTRSVSLAHFLS